MVTYARIHLVRNALIALVAFVVPGCNLNEDSESFRFDESIERVEVDVDAGLLSLRPSDGGRTRVDVSLEWGASDRPTIDVFVQDGTLYVRGDCSDRLACNTDFELFVPEEAEVNIDLASGSVDLRDLSGPLFADVSTGEIQGGGLRSDILHAEITTGSIDLSFSEGATTVYTDVVTGDLELEVPNRTYTVQSEVTTGSIQIDVPTSSDADAFIAASVVTGAVYVHAAG